MNGFWQHLLLINPLLNCWITMNKKISFLRILIAAIAVSHIQFSFAGKNANANAVSNTRAKTAARAEGIVDEKPVTEPKKGGYHVGPDTRYQPSKKDESVVKKSGGKDLSGKYREENRR